ncbi:MAG: hypothetical protein Q8O75_00905 [bacterium]|nr:hypothetical protein [bacterium]
MSNFWAKYKVILLVISLALILTGLIFIFYRQFLNKESSTTATATQKTATSSEKVATASPKPDDQNSSAAVTDDSAAIKTALVEKTSIAESNLDFEISQNTGKHAKGMVKEKDSEVGGGYWLAAKTSGGWVIVYDGQAQPTCNQIASYSFPTDMVPECLDANGNLVAR